MDLKLDPLAPMNVTAVDDNDLTIDVSKAVDLDMANTSFASYGEGVDLTDFMKEKVGNYDYLDLNEEDLKTIPSPDVDASADPELEAALMPERLSRGQGASRRAEVVHHEHLRETKKAALPVAPVESILVDARKLMMAGVRGREVLVRLASKYPQHAMEAAWPTLQSYSVDQWILGNVILEPELFASCKEMSKFLKEHKVGTTAKMVKVCAECEGCPYRKESFCEAFQKSIVTRAPDSPKLLQAYLANEVPAPQVDKIAGLALKKSGSPLRALAHMFMAKDTAARRVARRQVSNTIEVGASPEPRVVHGAPRESVLATLTDLVERGMTVDRIRTHTANYVGGSSFTRMWREAMEARGSVAWTTYGSCDHPLLMQQSKIKLEAGPHCAGCTFNYGDYCNMNKKAFTQSFTPPPQQIDAADIVREEEEPFVGTDTTLTVEPSTPQTVASEVQEMGLSDEIEV